MLPASGCCLLTAALPDALCVFLLPVLAFHVVLLEKLSNFGEGAKPTTVRWALSCWIVDGLVVRLLVQVKIDDCSQATH